MAVRRKRKRVSEKIYSMNRYKISTIVESSAVIGKQKLGNGNAKCIYLRRKRTYSRNSSASVPFWVTR